ncbi:MAG: elongation factor G, partial [Planctomycetes bacterium]|nr:elongation factor G [Planctomycetota bacterium]
ELISQLWRMQADSREKLEEATAGDIVGVVGPKDAVTGDTLCDNNHPILLESIRFPETVISMAIEPDSSADRKKLEDTLKLMSKQDPTFSAKVSEETGQTIVSGMGELHLEIISKRMERDFHIKMRAHKPRVTYRETVGAKVEINGLFDRQNAGVRQFAEVRISLEPAPDEAGITVINKMKPNVLPPELAEIFVNALKDELKGGGLVGYQLINTKAIALDATYREGETTETAIRAAVADAVRQALQKVGTILLEPIMKLEVVTPSDFVGNISADLNSRRAMIVNTELRGHLVVMTAEAPLSNMFGYSTDVRSLSQGRASFTMEPLRYDAAPPQADHY